MNSEILYSMDKEVIVIWAKEALRDQLYTEGRVLKYVFLGEAKIYCMAYLQNIGCSLYHDMPERFYQSKNPWLIGSVYVRPEYRHQGYGLALSKGMFEYKKKYLPEIK